MQQTVTVTSSTSTVTVSLSARTIAKPLPRRVAGDGPVHVVGCAIADADRIDATVSTIESGATVTVTVTGCVNPGSPG